MPENMTFFKGEKVFADGDAISRAYVIKHGAVDMFKVVRNRRLHLARFGPGQVLGEAALLPGAAMTVAMEASEDGTELMPVDLTLLQSLLEKSPNPVRRIVNALLLRQQNLHEFIAAQPSDTMFHSVIRILWLMHRAQAATAEEAPGVSRNELAANVQTVARIAAVEVDYVLNELTREGLLAGKEIMGEKIVENFWGEVEKRTKAVVDQTYTLVRPDVFLDEATAVADAYRAEIAPPFVGDLECMDLEALATSVRIDPQALLRGVCKGDVPISLVCLRREATLEWLGGGKERLTKE